MTAVAITGAAGRVGTVAREAFGDDPPTLFTHAPEEGIDSRVLDVDDPAAFRDAMAGQDVLVHLAWAPASPGAWTDGHGENVRAVYNAYEAARANDLQRVVFASSSHVTGMYNRGDPADMERVAADADTAVSPADPVRPDSYYAVAKVACEAMGGFYADRFGVEVVNLRLGWLMTREELAETQDADAARARFARAMWLSPRDCRDAVRAAALTTLARTPLTVNAVSRNDERYLTLAETLLHLGYRPRDNATEALADESG